MSKHRRSVPGRKAPVLQAPPPDHPLFVQLIGRTRQNLLETCLAVGMGVVPLLLEQDREWLCGVRSKFQKGREAYRYGHDKGSLTLGGRRVTVDKPRVRKVGGGEIPLPSWDRFSSWDPLDERVLGQILLGVSTRRYEASLEDVPEDLDVHGTNRSSVSRRFVAMTTTQVRAYLSRSLAELDLTIIMVDGLVVAERTVLVALGVTATGEKHVLGLVEGSTESYEVCRSLFRDLVGRGLALERPCLFVIDGGKGLIKAIHKVFSPFALIQRCQVHKRRNIEEHLPESRRPWVRQQLEAAWQAATVKQAREKMQALAATLQEEYPAAAASIREGLEETLTLIKLGVKGSLARSLRSTNPIENLNGSIRRTTRNVKRWRNGQMILRWIGTALQAAEGRFYKIRGCKDLPSLVLALEQETKKNRLHIKDRVA